MVRIRRGGARRGGGERGCMVVVVVMMMTMRELDRVRGLGEGVENGKCVDDG